MRKKSLLIMAAILSMASSSYAALESIGSNLTQDNLTHVPESDIQSVIVPTWDIDLSFAKISPINGPIHLKGVQPDENVQFGVRSDQMVTSALLNLEFTPSPSLLPIESQLKVFLNDELMGVLAIKKEDLGKKTKASLPIDTRYIKDFNQIRMEFVGHYRDICENPASTTLWLDVSQASNLNMNVEALALKNDLSNFPIPFFDSRDLGELTLPIIFSQAASIKQQNAAAILTSWLGTKAKWRNQNYPVFTDELPDRHSVVFMTNEKRPKFLADFPEVQGPMIEMISHPDNPYIKLLLVQGRNDDDLIQAAKGIAQGELLFRGSAVSVDKIDMLSPRVPYDAPNWVRTDKPISFAELVSYKGQLQSTGLNPKPISVDLSLPPDLFTFRDSGIEMRLDYRYTAPNTEDGSKMLVSLNDQLIKSQALLPNQKEVSLLTRLPFVQGLFYPDNSLDIPALKLGEKNQLKFTFNYSNPIAGGSAEQCVTYQPIPNTVTIDENSTIDFSGYRHYMAMPDLRAFSQSGFPFSRMADLSETIVLTSSQASAEQVSTLLNTMGMIGAQTGFPAINVSLTDDWNSAKNKDADILFIGEMSDELLKNDQNLELLLNKTKSWIKMPMRPAPILAVSPRANDSAVNSQTTVTSQGNIAAIIGFQSPFNEHRSIVALLADNPKGFSLLNNTIADSGQRNFVSDSVSVIRDSGVNSVRVGEIYYVGYLPWWEKVWAVFMTHPILLSFLAVAVVIICGLLLWKIMSSISRRRLLSK
ncbi:cellulose biosynthesis cyclic di-GMP-binding regulatory protein BcsB [Providencia burhodogranariea]|uniref:Cyclic di-GMP-binding protein n=1 Tax=Providencia burhodogranariea DSM 19968 TaxID=1141662 RepID=K8W984_9GAMM|nr:cellulose biosynthesis cyclic di-GMP-binding regulatory protein BcsB [Providencia burhodogranariea]EKT57233.1 cellulose synthase regulator protein [Providencia burhodogranariea DSM 19968]